MPPMIASYRDMDSNGWPKHGRDAALRAIRKGFAFHLAGDQHLGSTIQYGVDAWGDAGYALCVPSVANVYPRRWYPPVSGANRLEGAPKNTGDFLDGFGNHMTVLAVSNPYETGMEPTNLYDRAPGYGIVRLNREARTLDIANWPRHVGSGRRRAHTPAGPSPSGRWTITAERLCSLVAADTGARDGGPCRAGDRRGFRRDRLYAAHRRDDILAEGVCRRLLHAACRRPGRRHADLHGRSERFIS